MTSLAELTNATRYKPKYVDLAESILDDIARRRLAPGDQLATESDLVEQHKLSRVTVRQALELLENGGYISRRRGIGTFVARSVDPMEQTGQRHGAILIICSSEDSQHREDDKAFVTILHAMEHALSENGYATQLLVVGREAKTDRAQLIRSIRNENVCGVLTIGSCLDPYQDLIDDDVLVVAASNFHSRVQPQVGQNACPACRDLITYLIDHGHEDIAMVCSSLVDGQTLAMFARGYQEAHDQTGLEVNRARMFYAHPDESLKKLSISVLSQRPRPTAVFCENWQVCRAMLDAARELNLNVPQDVSLVGYGQNVSEITEPVRMTAYMPGNEAMGRAAVEMLIQRITAKGAAVQSRTLPGRLVEGDSVMQREEPRRGG